MITYKKLNYLLLTFILILSLSQFQTVQAHDYYKIPLRIQVVDPSGMNDTTIRENIDTMNDIFKGCRIKFNVIEIVHLDSGHDLIFDKIF